MQELDFISIKSARRFSTASPLRYPGGKAALAGFFARLIEELGLDDPTYVEPFAGGVGAGLALLRDDVVQKLVINDYDAAVYCFWNAVVNDNDRFLNAVADVPLTVNEWRYQRDIYRLADERDPFALGFAFFYLNRTNRSGVLNAGVIGGQSQTGNYKIDARFNRDELCSRISHIGLLKDRIEVTDQDGRRVISRYAAQESAFLYIDPPYVEKGSSLYLNSFTHRDHAELAETINEQTAAHWVLTYDISDLIQNLYSAHRVLQYELTYSAHRPGRARELIVASRSLAEIIDQKPLGATG